MAAVYQGNLYVMMLCQLLSLGNIGDHPQLHLHHLLLLALPLAPMEDGTTDTQTPVTTSAPVRSKRLYSVARMERRSRDDVSVILIPILIGLIMIMLMLGQMYY
jgi:hypothetical protein